MKYIDARLGGGGSSEGSGAAQTLQAVEMLQGLLETICFQELQMMLRS